MSKFKFNFSDNTSKESNEFSLTPPYINIIEVPSTATQGTLTAAQLATLNSAPQEAYIMFYGEKFIPMDVQDSAGYRVYTHHGETDGTKIETSKFIYLTLTTGAWSMNINEEKIYYNHSIYVQYSGLYLNINVISTDNTPFTALTFCSLYNNITLPAFGFCKPLTTDHSMIVRVLIRNEEYNQFRCDTVIYSKDNAFTFNPLNYVAGVSNSGGNFLDIVTPIL